MDHSGLLALVPYLDKEGRLILHFSMLCDWVWDDLRHAPITGWKGHSMSVQQVKDKSKQTDPL